MRTVAILTALFAAASIVSYQVLRNDAAGTENDHATQNADPGVNERLGELESSLRHYQQDNRDRLQELVVSQAKLNSTLADLDSQLKSLVTAQVGSAMRSAMADLDETAGETDSADPQQSGSEPAHPSEARIGRLMDDALMSGDWDMDATELARSQTVEIIAKLPGVNLADMVCNEGVCRATFTKLDGGVPEIGEIWGEPPFMNDGFTINNDDGSVVLYVAQSGVSLDDVREKVLAGY